jgi:hypothetical protein
VSLAGSAAHFDTILGSEDLSTWEQPASTHAMAMAAGLAILCIVWSTELRDCDSARPSGPIGTEAPKSRAVGEGSNVQYAQVRVDGIPTDSIAPALVVIPTNSPQNHYF